MIEKRLSDQVANMKMSLENFKNQEPDAASALQDAESTLRKEQGLRGGNSGRIERWVKKLQPAAKQRAAF